jgi:hypothetical protein
MILDPELGRLGGGGQSSQTRACGGCDGERGREEVEAEVAGDACDMTSIVEWRVKKIVSGRKDTLVCVL